jgi:hypothetical protein
MDRAGPAPRPLKPVQHPARATMTACSVRRRSRSPPWCSFRRRPAPRTDPRRPVAAAAPRRARPRRARSPSSPGSARGVPPSAPQTPRAGRPGPRPRRAGAGSAAERWPHALGRRPRGANLAPASHRPRVDDLVPPRHRRRGPGARALDLGRQARRLGHQEQGAVPRREGRRTRGPPPGLAPRRHDLEARAPPLARPPTAPGSRSTSAARSTSTTERPGESCPSSASPRARPRWA